MTYAVAGGPIRVVLVREEQDWFAWFSTNAQASVREILEAVADRGAIEENFIDLKQVHGSGQQQLRNVHANIGAFNLLAWLHTLVELWAWNLPHEQLCDRRSSPWDDPYRRPSHGDRCKALRRACFLHEISAVPLIGPNTRKIRSLLERLIALVA